jgi:outer membrane protein assembly factor BamB/Icc-related predicted phosphoesterase
MKSIFIWWCLMCSAFFLKAQAPFKFAFVSDTHVGSETGAADLSITVRDINADTSIRFVVLTGDITEFGADDEIQLAKAMLDSLNKPWYIIPGNHDANWSESGSNTFKRIFGAETFSFTYGGFCFLGTACGPNMRMGPGQVPREHINWLDSTLKSVPKDQPIIFLNHYPLDSALNNWFEVIDRLKNHNTQMVLCGHGHSNHSLNFEGLPAVMGRSNLRAKAAVGGYNIVTIDGGKASFQEKNPVTDSLKAWTSVALIDHRGLQPDTAYYRPSYSINKSFEGHLNWTYQNAFDIGSGLCADAQNLYFTDAGGKIACLDRSKGTLKWVHRVPGKIYSTPALQDDVLIFGCSDGSVYGLNRQTGKQKWKVAAQKAVLGSPVIYKNRVFIGASDGHFRCLDLQTGALIWDFAEVKGFVVTTPLLYNGQVFFGCWNNDFYALDIETGHLNWKWNNGSTNRMYSPAACYPVATKGRVFLVAPDRYMTCLDAKDGRVIWRKQNAAMRVRESMGLSRDSLLVFAKTMDGQILGMSAVADSMQVDWAAKVQLPYEICPTHIVERDGRVYVPTQSGLVVAIDRVSGKKAWEYKVSNALVTDILPLDKRKVAVVTMDGKIVMLSPR